MNEPGGVDSAEKRYDHGSPEDIAKIYRQARGDQQQKCYKNKQMLYHYVNGIPRQITQGIRFHMFIDVARDGSYPFDISKVLVSVGLPLSGNWDRFRNRFR